MPWPFVPGGSIKPATTAPFEALRKALGHYQRALEEPVLECADLVPDHELPYVELPF